MLLSQRRASLREEPKWLMPETPLEIGSEMAKLVLEMRDNGGEAGAKKRRLEMLAEHFLDVDISDDGRVLLQCSDVDLIRS